VTADEVNPEVTAGVAAVEQRMTQLMDRIRLAYRDLALAVDPALPPFGLKILRLIERQGPVTSGGIAEALAVDPSTVSRQLRQLEELGLAEAGIDPADRRARIIDLTAEGRRRMADLGPQREQLSRFLNTWDADDLRRFAGYLDRLIQN
jgi:DNA-binding MarR family transcriptional regulator